MLPTSLRSVVLAGHHQDGVHPWQPLVPAAPNCVEVAKARIQRQPQPLIPSLGQQPARKRRRRVRMSPPSQRRSRAHQRRWRSWTKPWLRDWYRPNKCAAAPLQDYRSCCNMSCSLSSNCIAEAQHCHKFQQASVNTTSPPSSNLAHVADACACTNGCTGSLLVAVGCADPGVRKMLPAHVLRLMFADHGCQQFMAV